MAKAKKYNYITRTVTLPDGRRKYVRGKTKAEVDRKVAEIKADIAGGLNVDDRTTFGEVAKLWYDKYQSPYARDSTNRTVQSMINANVMSKLAYMRVRDITPLHIQDLVAGLIAREYSHTKTLLGYLREIFDLAIELGCISRSPVSANIKVPAYQPKRPKKILNRELEQKVLRTLVPYSRERLFFVCGVNTAARKGEIYALNWDAIDLTKRVIHVRRNVHWDKSGHPRVVNYTKTAAGMRDVPMSDDLYAELKQWGDWYGYRGYLFAADSDFATALSGKRVQIRWDRIRAAVAKHDPEYAKIFTAHTMRHTWITRMFEAGLDIKEIQSMAGHKDVATTLGTYTHFDAETRQDATFRRAREAMRADKSKVIAFQPKMVAEG